MKILAMKELIDMAENTEESYLMLFARKNPAEDWLPLILYGLDNKNTNSRFPLYEIFGKYMSIAIEVEVDESDLDDLKINENSVSLIRDIDILPERAITQAIVVMFEAHNKLIEYIKQLERKLK